METANGNSLFAPQNSIARNFFLLIRLFGLLRTFALLLALGLFGQIFYSHAQNIARSEVATAEAVSIATQLQAGMTEQDAATFLKHHGISQNFGTNGVYSVSVGCSHGWTTAYPLADGRSLDLDFRPRSISPHGVWGGNGLLERAGIRSNGVDIVTIALKKAEPDGAANATQPIRSQTNSMPGAAGSRR